MSQTHFDNIASTYDDEPRRVALMRAVGETIVREVALRTDMDVFDYGCGTGLVGLFLRPCVRSVTGADNSAGMLDVLRRKTAQQGLTHMHALQLDLQTDPVPKQRYDLIVTSMAMHHLHDLPRVLKAFRTMLRPQGVLCLADLDTEPGTFHPADGNLGVHHHGFDRATLKQQLRDLGFTDVRDTTATTIRKPVDAGHEEEFSVFLITAR